MSRNPQSLHSELLSYLSQIGYRDLYLESPNEEPPSEELPSEESPDGQGAEVVADRSAAAEGSDSASVGSLAAARADGAERAEALAALAEQASACTACQLSRGRNSVVFGSGSPDADLMFIGEGPGAAEDRQGLPFVGPAGELLTKIIQAIDMERDDVYIANIVKCRPPGNRDPEPAEVASCRGYLERQIELIRPLLIVALGRVAAQTLLGNDLALGRMRGQWHEVMGVPTMVTYHPAFLLRNASYKRPVWEDMQQVRDRLAADRRARSTS